MKKEIMIMFSVLFFAALACGLRLEDNAASTPASDANSVATLVAATLTALAGPAPAAVTETPAPPVPPVLHVAYIKGANVWLWKDGAGSVQLTSGGTDTRVRISSDGQVLAFERERELWAVNADGSGLRALVSRAYLDASPAAADGTALIEQFLFAPGTHDVFFSTLAATEGYPAPQDEIQIVNADSPSPRILAPRGQGGVLYFSPDARLVAISRPQAVSIMNLDGSGYRDVLTFPPVMTYSEWSYKPQVVWKPVSDGMRVVVPASAILDNPTETTKLWDVPLAGAPVLAAEVQAVPVWVSFPYLSPNGLNLVYLYENGTIYELHVLDASLSSALFASYSAMDSVGLLGWSPDSAHFLFWRADVRIPYYAAFGADPALLTDTAHAESVRWVNDAAFLFINDTELRLRRWGSPSEIIDTAPGIGEYDFVIP